MIRAAGWAVALGLLTYPVTLWAGEWNYVGTTTRNSDKSRADAYVTAIQSVVIQGDQYVQVWTKIVEATTGSERVVERSIFDCRGKAEMLEIMYFGRNPTHPAGAWNRPSSEPLDLAPIPPDSLASSIERIVCWGRRA